MKCPSCRDVELDERYRHGTEVDICPKCKGIWLDRNELDRLLAGAESGDRENDATEDSSGGITPADLAVLSKPAGDNRDDHASGDSRDERSRDDDRDSRDDHDRRTKRDDKDDDYKRRPKRKKSRTKRLGDLLEDVLDEVFD